MVSREIKISSEKELQNIAEQLASEMNVGDVVCLTGNLGAGKTTFTKYLINKFLPNENVTSPTFNLLQTYESGSAKIYHYDLYRIKHEEELEDLSLDDALSEGITIIEWWQKAENWLPKNRIEIQINYTESGNKNERDIKIIRL